MRTHSRWVVALTAVAVTSVPVLAETYKGFTRGYCTYFAAGEFDRVAPGPHVNWHGDAGEWVERADAAGWLTVRNPRAVALLGNGALAVWKGQGFGHVAVIRAVRPNAGSGGLDIEEMNWGLHADADGKTEQFDHVSRTFLSWSDVAARGRRGQFQFSGYVIPIRKDDPRLHSPAR